MRYAHIIDALSKVLTTQKTLLTLGVVKVTPENTLFSQVLKAREMGIFRSDASIKEICNLILKSNGIGEANATDKMELLIVVPFLKDYLPSASYPQ
ncbi:hypothetical protein FACS1894176_07270 [Bacteroidia bacterium]|nr:hypothetical protein FACS1894176_07270 [Bacteroidia bacterium]